MNKPLYFARFLTVPDFEDTYSEEKGMFLLDRRVCYISHMQT